MKKLVIASNNNGKIKEIKEILKDIPVQVVSLLDENINIDVIEDGETFEENAKKKAQEICDFLLREGKTDFIVMADDSGLEVKSLNGEPGVYSARYAGEHGNDKKNNEKLLEKLTGIEDRSARFVCQLALISSEKKYKSITGYVDGYILEEIIGNGGFGYDPLFFCPKINKSFGEASSEEKNKISHRGMALEGFKSIIKEFL